MTEAPPAPVEANARHEHRVRVCDVDGWAARFVDAKRAAPHVRQIVNRGELEPWAVRRVVPNPWIENPDPSSTHATVQFGRFDLIVTGGVQCDASTALERFQLER
jgi:hypothetical protein